MSKKIVWSVLMVMSFFLICKVSSGRAAVR